MSADEKRSAISAGWVARSTDGGPDDGPSDRFEALARFGSGASPTTAFDQARGAGLLLDLEAAAVRAALRRF
jgi:hypothetical protein